MSARVVAVGALITDESGRILLILRRNEPSAGHWSLPGGRVEPGESLERAVIREVEEETGLRVTVGEPAIQLEIPVGDGRVYEVHDFRAEIRSGNYVQVTTPRTRRTSHRPRSVGRRSRTAWWSTWSRPVCCRRSRPDGAPADGPGAAGPTWCTDLVLCRMEG